MIKAKPLRRFAALYQERFGWSGFKGRSKGGGIASGRTDS
ncbi:hypothetical protein PSEUDO8BK_60041 [Pseudomonas sp. 8BK]|nr:hypothetical protein PSEUDO8BK_60041 [Pseudomonas sp. 8BK]